MRFEIPQVDESNYELSIDTREVLVFIGANGSGKTRLGYYLEKRLFSLTTLGFKVKNAELRD